MSNTDETDDLAALQRRLADIEQEHARLRILTSSAAALAAARLDLPVVLDTVALRLASEIQDWCLIRLVSPDGQWLNTVAARHRDPEADAVLRTLSMEVHHPVGQGLQGRVIAN